MIKQPIQNIATPQARNKKTILNNEQQPIQPKQQQQQQAKPK